MKATGLFLHTVHNPALSMKKIFLLFPSSVSFDATNIEDENKLKQYLDNYFRALEGFVKRLEVFCKFGGSLFARLLSFYTNKPH